MQTQTLGSKLAQLLATRRPPVAITFSDAPVEGVERVAKSAAAGCGYWRQAADGEVFYTEASDHFCCPVGAHTHNVPLPDEVKQELQGLIGTMVGLEYLTMEDVPNIPQRRTPLRYATYAPVDKAPAEADVVLVLGNVRQLMLVAEAAQSAGVQGDSATLGRPTCAVLPQAIAQDKTASSFGCIGNRVYTGAQDGEGYVAIPGSKLAAVVERLETMVNANQELERFHRARAANAQP